LARKCISFDFNDTGESISFLAADLDLKCDGDDAQYVALSSFFWPFFVLWVVLVPMSCLALVLRVQGCVRAMRISPLANACRFLWKDYDQGFLYWEVVDLLRKLMLTVLVLFVDTEFGDSRLLRLALGAMVSATYLALLTLTRPFKHSEDLHLACMSSLLLTGCFVSGLIIKLLNGCSATRPWSARVCRKGRKGWGFGRN
jgi:hypothetical protein